ncbi:hypothetical protein J2847_005820 [Azospirillum agricola]|uniref:hypothetical protein n=1 Tax=Azospirillum agricola TaxID=1720247 RepID=UPI001AE962E7|nr:hypothetical protein [Azospirillum agricola]MBP2232491.1 hypothetical protein [Azospirillum agricola]
MGGPLISNDDLMLLLWASVWLPAAIHDDSWHFDNGIVIPAVERMPDLQHEDWPALREKLMALRDAELAAYRRAA